MSDLSVKVCGITFKNPVIAASGTFGFGREYAEYFDLSILGGISVKGLTLAPREGNKPPRIAETPMGILNSVGLQNPGADAFAKTELPYLRKFDTVIIANISGNTVGDYARLAEKVSDADMIEVNVSCPNVKAGGMAFGTSCENIAEVTRAVKAVSKIPVIVKLSPNVTDIAAMAKSAQDAGADAISLINTLQGMRINVNTRKPILGNVTGGLSGPAVFPVAVRMVYAAAKAVTIPIIGMGGVETGENAAELMLAGASLVGVGTATMRDPYAMPNIISGLNAYLDKFGIKSARELTGAVRA